MFERRLRLTTEHARDFCASIFCRHFAQVGVRASFRDFFRDDEMPRRCRRHLGQVRDAKHLVIFAERLHLRPDGIRDFAADVRVDLVEDEQRDRVLCRER